MTPGGAEHGPRDRRLRLAASIYVYLALYIFLDWVSLIDPASPLGITPWNPPAGLSLALLLRHGWRTAPAVFAAVLLSDLLFRDMSAAPWAAAAAAAAIAGGYGGAAALLKQRLGFDPALGSRNDLVVLLGVAIPAAAAIAVVVVALYCAAGLLPWADYVESVLRFGVGDVLGIAVLTPFLLVMAARRHAPALIRPAAALEYGFQLGAIGLGLWIIFGLESANHFEFSYVLFLPLIWIALREGLVGAAWGVVATQIGLIAAIQVKGFDAETITQFQLLMLAVAVTGIFLGGVVDERQRAEGALRESEARLQTVVSTAPDAILTFDDDGRIASANRAAANLFGGGLRALTERAIASLLPGVGVGAQASGREMTAERLDGSTFAAEVGVGQAEAGGRRIHVAVVRDITARKAAEAALQQHETQLAHAARLTAAGEMAAGLAHELNQPLTAVIGFARACEAVLEARGAAAEAEARSHIGQAVQQALRAGEIIRRTREFLRRGDLRPVKIAVADLVGMTLDLVRTEMELARVRVEVRLPPDLPPVFVDPIQIEQVLLNLLRNSMEETIRSGGAKREIRLAAAVAAEAPDFIDITVADSGRGIPPEIADRLFTPFATTKEAGMGLGLSISRSIIEAHGGSIAAMPSPAGAGAEIRFTVPVYVDEPGETDA